MNRCNKVEYDIDYMTRTLHVHACHADENRATQHGGDDERGLALTWPVHRGAHTHVSSQQCRGCAGSRDRGRCGVPARGQPHARKAEVRAKWRGVGVECACGEGGGGGEVGGAIQPRIAAERRKPIVTDHSRHPRWDWKWQRYI